MPIWKTYVIIFGALSKTYLAVIFLVVVAGGLFVGQRYVSRQRVTNPSPSVPVLTPKAAAPMIPVKPPASTSSAKTSPSGEFHLTLATPQDGETFNTAKIQVSGKTSPNADITVDGKKIKADGNGDFSGFTTLSEGPSTLVITASDKTGNFVEKDLEITYTPAK